MERLRRKRTTVRAAVTRIINEMTTLMQTEPTPTEGARRRLQPEHFGPRHSSRPEAPTTAATLEAPGQQAGVKMAARLLVLLAGCLQAAAAARAPICGTPEAQQASGLEALLQRLRPNMTELQFLVVNDRKSAHLRDHLERRVSFAVHQETEEEPVWTTMEGGKDDVEDSLRRAYDGEPCGLTCEEPTERNPRNTDTSARRNSLGWRVLHMFFGGGQDDEPQECDERMQTQMRVCCHPNSRTESPYCRQAPSCEELGAACGS
ncbi:hypothetical protein MTO96_027345 [Rhipicephalus appendiculatus]